jgi:hypothetical protein
MKAGLLRCQVEHFGFDSTSFNPALPQVCAPPHSPSRSLAPPHAHAYIDWPICSYGLILPAS